MLAWLWSVVWAWWAWVSGLGCAFVACVWLLDRFLFRGRQDAVAPTVGKHAFFVTGGGSGLGLAATRALSGAGHVVFAGCFLPGEADALRKLQSGAADVAAEDRVASTVVPVHIDVCDAASIAAAVKEVEAELARRDLQLYAVLNNAGIAVSAPLVCVPDADLRRQLEVNFFGHIAVTRAVLPLLLRAALSLNNDDDVDIDGGGGSSRARTKGAAMRPGVRVVNTISVAGRVSSAQFGPYSASKFAMEAANDALRQELHRFGVLVVAVEPTFIKTPLVLGAERRTLDFWQRSCQNKQLYPAHDQYIRHSMTAVVERASLEIDAVVPDFVDALTSTTPKTHYLIAPPAGPHLMARVPGVFIRDAIERLVTALFERKFDSPVPDPRSCAQAFLDAHERQQRGAAGKAE